MERKDTIRQKQHSRYRQLNLATLNSMLDAPIHGIPRQRPSPSRSPSRRCHTNIYVKKCKGQIDWICSMHCKGIHIFNTRTYTKHQREDKVLGSLNLQECSGRGPRGTTDALQPTLISSKTIFIHPNIFIYIYISKDTRTLNSHMIVVGPRTQIKCSCTRDPLGDNLNRWTTFINSQHLFRPIVKCHLFW